MIYTYKQKILLLQCASKYSNFIKIHTFTHVKLAQ